MSHARNRLRAFGLGLVAALGLAALMAGGAQAASWLVGGATLSGHASIDANVHPDALLLLLVPTLAGGFEVDCLKVSVTEGLLLGSALTEPGVAHGVFDFKECKTYIAGVPQGLCNPVGGLIEIKTLVTPVTHNGVTKLLFSPVSALIVIDPECPLPLKNKLTGKLLASCLNGLTTLLDCLTAQTKVPLKQIAALSHALSYGLHAATLDGIIDVFNPGGASLAAHP